MVLSVPCWPLTGPLCAMLQPLEMVGFGMPRLLQLAGKLISDNTPEAREAAKRLVALLLAAFADPVVEQQLDVQVCAGGWLKVAGWSCA
jgi:hypothetical protein